MGQASPATAKHPSASRATQFSTAASVLSGFVPLGRCGWCEGRVRLSPVLLCQRGFVPVRAGRVRGTNAWPRRHSHRAALITWRMGWRRGWALGRRIRDAAIAFLLQNAGMSSADEIVVSGTSAGGLAVYLNIDQIAEQLPDGARVRGLASAGYFLAAGPAGGYQDQMLELAREQNATAALSPACRAAAAAEGRPAESCFFAEHAAAFIKTPTFALQSRFDTWQLAHIPHVATSNVSGVYAYGNLIRQRIQPLVDAAGPGRAAELPRHAVWLSPCETHGALPAAPFRGVKVLTKVAFR